MTKKKFSLKQFFANYTIHIIFLAMIVVVTVLRPNFLTWPTIRTILVQSSPRIVMALGVMFVILSGGADLSGGRQVGFIGVLTGFLMQQSTYANKMYPWIDEPPIIVALLVVFCFGAIFGFMNGVIVSVLRVPAFIGTLGVQLFVYGLNLVHYNSEPNNSQPVGSFTENLNRLGTGSFFHPRLGLPYILAIALVLLLACHIVLTYTRFGKNLFAMGGNIEAARVSGIKTVRTQIIVYVIAGVFYSLCGFLEAARANAADAATTGMGYEFDAISSCVVGGVSIAGGVGAVPGVFIGVLLYNFISFGMTFLGINPNWQYVVKGAVLVLCVGIDIQKYVRKR